MMTFVDTNYFLRFLLADNKEQSEEVKKLFLAAGEGKVALFTSLIVIFEIYWVLSSYYEQDKSKIILILEKILSLGFIELREQQQVSEALEMFSGSPLSFEDCYNLVFAESAKAERFATFDQKLTKAWENR